MDCFSNLPEGVKILAVSKKQSAERIRELWFQGQKCFGENYLQEALPKIASLSDTDIQWHYIGKIQRNKTAQIAENFSWVHTIDNAIIARRLSAQRPEKLVPLQVCMQINFEFNEITSQRAGVKPEEALILAQEILKLPQLQLRGLMMIAPIASATATFDEQCSFFRPLRELLESLNKNLSVKLDTLSMGMSADYKAAIAEGATLVRLGTAIFGRRL